MISLKLALIIAVFLLFSVYAQTLVTAESEYRDIIVIGAGMAGIAAANQLNENGYDVIVLEARDRIGGRILTDNSYEGYHLDVGASWIHGVDNNPIAMLAEKYGLETVPFDNEESYIIYDENGEKIDEQRATSMWEILSKFEEFYKTERSNLAAGEDISLQDAVDKFIQNENLTAEELNDFYFSLVWTIEGDYAADTSDISLMSFENMGYKMEGHEVIFPQGYGQIIDGLSNGLDIRLEHVVTELDYSGDTIKIKTNKGDFDAKYVINTLPLGVLKNNKVIFSPDLPQEKINAISNLDMGLLNKVYFVFPDVFWDREYQWIGHIDSQKGHWAYFANLYTVLEEPVILAFNTASFAHEIEEKSDVDIVNEGLSVLKTIYGDAVTEPLYTKVTKWASDEFSFGSYSSTGVDSSNDDFYELSKSLDNKVFFAGEATEVNYPATVHGAYFSGVREANKIQWLEGNMLTPKAQLDNWVLPTYVICKDDLELLIIHDGESAACVTGETKDILEKRGWGYTNIYAQ